MLTGDRVHSIFTQLDDAQDKEDMLFILKQLAADCHQINLNNSPNPSKWIYQQLHW